MTEAQQLIATVLRAHHSCTSPEQLAEEIDKALGGLRKIEDTGLLTATGFLTTVYPGITHEPGVRAKQYTKWVSGWSEAKR